MQSFRHCTEIRNDHSVLSQYLNTQAPSLSMLPHPLLPGSRPTHRGRLRSPPSLPSVPSLGRARSEVAACSRDPLQISLLPVLGRRCEWHFMPPSVQREVAIQASALKQKALVFVRTPNTFSSRSQTLWHSHIRGNTRKGSTCLCPGSSLNSLEARVLSRKRVQEKVHRWPATRKCVRAIYGLPLFEREHTQFHTAKNNVPPKSLPFAPSCC